MSSTIVLGTRNAGKISELRAVLGVRWTVKGLEDFGSDIPDVVEDGDTYRENALKKATAYQKWVGLPVLADDSGLEVDALGGAPGVHSAYYGGENISWPERWAHLYRELAPHPPEKWTGRFRCVLCYVDGQHLPRFFEAVTEGHVLPRPQGNQGFGYDPILWSNDLKCSFGEASADQKNQVSHRARALHAFANWMINNPSGK